MYIQTRIFEGHLYTYDVQLLWYTKSIILVINDLFNYWETIVSKYEM